MTISSAAARLIPANRRLKSPALMAACTWPAWLPSGLFSRRLRVTTQLFGNPGKDRLRKTRPLQDRSGAGENRPGRQYRPGAASPMHRREAPGRIGDTQALRPGMVSSRALSSALASAAGKTETRVITCHQAQDYIDLGKGLGNLAVQHVKPCRPGWPWTAPGHFRASGQNDRQQAGEATDWPPRQRQNKGAAGEPLLFARSPPARWLVATASPGTLSCRMVIAVAHLVAAAPLGDSIRRSAISISFRQSSQRSAFEFDKPMLAVTGAWSGAPLAVLAQAGRQFALAGGRYWAGSGTNSSPPQRPACHPAADTWRWWTPPLSEPRRRLHGRSCR